MAFQSNAAPVYSLIITDLSEEFMFGENQWINDRSLSTEWLTRAVWTVWWIVKLPQKSSSAVLPCRWEASHSEVTVVRKWLIWLRMTQVSHMPTQSQQRAFCPTYNAHNLFKPLKCIMCGLHIICSELKASLRFLRCGKNTYSVTEILIFGKEF